MLLTHGTNLRAHIEVLNSIPQHVTIVEDKILTSYCCDNTLNSRVGGFHFGFWFKDTVSHGSEEMITEK